MARQNDHIRAEELISPYLDNRVTAEDKTFFERHTAVCPDCRAKLESTRAMLTALRSMPAMKAPHSFVLPRKMARQPRPSILTWYPALRLATVVAAIAFVIVFAGDLLTNSLGGAAVHMAVPAAAPAPRVANQAPAAPAASATQVALAAPTQAPAAQPTAPPQPTEAPAAAPTQSAQAAESAPAAAGAAVMSTVTETAKITESRAPAPALGAAPEATSIAAATPEATRTPAAKPAADQAPPAAEQLRSTTATPPETPAINPLRVIELALLGLVVVLGVVTLLIRRRTV